MGGRGSGRRSSSGVGLTTEALYAVDVRDFARRGQLVPGPKQDAVWGGKLPQSDRVSAMCLPGQVILLVADGPEETARIRNQRVAVVTTPCRLGGERHWFLCPNPGCARRVAILYLRDRFACRNCHRLVYPSQRQAVTQAATRAATRARALRHRLGWPDTLNPPFWTRPSGMHRTTFSRLIEEYADLLDDIATAERQSARKTSSGPGSRSG